MEQLFVRPFFHYNTGKKKKGALVYSMHGDLSPTCLKVRQ